MLGSSLLRLRPKIEIEEFCRKFYDSNIFRAIVGGEDLWSSFCESSFNLIVEADPSFAQINRDLFQRELTALRMELFGLAWTHYLKRDKYLLREIAFTKSYVEQNGYLDIWDIMLEYNQIIATSSLEIVSGERMRRGYSTYINSFRFGLFTKWVKTGVDGYCAARVAGRMGCDVAWDEGITLQYLTTKLAYRLGCSSGLKTDTLLELSTILFGFYKGAKETIQSVKLY